MILLSLLVKSHMYDILLLVYQDAATQEFLFQFHRKDLIFLIRLSSIYTRSKASFNVRTNLFTPFFKILLPIHQSIIYFDWNNFFILFCYFSNVFAFCIRVCFCRFFQSIVITYMFSVILSFIFVPNWSYTIW